MPELLIFKKVFFSLKKKTQSILLNIENFSEKKSILIKKPKRYLYVKCQFVTFKLI